MRAIRLVAIALLAWLMQSRADTVRFSDTVFANANWSATKFLDGSFSAFGISLQEVTRISFDRRTSP